jgi:hypothetical protein
MKKHLAIFIILCLGMIFFVSCKKDVTVAGTIESVPTQFSELGFAEVLSQAQQENKHVLVDFFSPT